MERVVYMGEIIDVYKILVGKHYVKKTPDQNTLA
jgi:hypothetical protein